MLNVDYRLDYNDKQNQKQNKKHKQSIVLSTINCPPFHKTGSNICGMEGVHPGGQSAMAINLRVLTPKTTI